jgi:hypothetical protein
MPELGDRGVNPAIDDPRFMLEINADSREAVIEFRESLAFHADSAQQKEQRGHPGAHLWAELVDKGGYLTSDAAYKVAVEMSRILDNAGVKNVQVEYASGLEYDDEASMALSFVSSYSDGETYAHWHDRIGWNIVACVINATDPGTFNFPYLFSALLYH